MVDFLTSVAVSDSIKWLCNMGCSAGVKEPMTNAYTEPRAARLDAD